MVRTVFCFIRPVPEVTQVGQDFPSVFPVDKIQAVFVVMSAPVRGAEECGTRAPVIAGAQQADSQGRKELIREEQWSRRVGFQVRVAVEECILSAVILQIEFAQFGEQGGVVRVAVAGGDYIGNIDGHPAGGYVVRDNAVPQIGHRAFDVSLQNRPVPAVSVDVQALRVGFRGAGVRRE